MSSTIKPSTKEAKTFKQLPFTHLIYRLGLIVLLNSTIPLKLASLKTSYLNTQTDDNILSAKVEQQVPTSSDMNVAICANAIQQSFDFDVANLTQIIDDSPTGNYVSKNVCNKEINNLVFDNNEFGVSDNYNVNTPN